MKSMRTRRPFVWLCKSRYQVFYLTLFHANYDCNRYSWYSLVFMMMTYFWLFMRLHFCVMIIQIIFFRLCFTLYIMYYVLILRISKVFMHCENHASHHIFRIWIIVLRSYNVTFLLILSFFQPEAVGTRFTNELYIKLSIFPALKTMNSDCLNIKSIFLLTVYLQFSH